MATETSRDDASPAEQLATLRRAQAEAQTRSSLTSAWYPIAEGVIGAAVVSTLVLSGVASLLTWAAIVIALVVVTNVERKRRGVKRATWRAHKRLRWLTAKYVVACIVGIVVLTAAQLVAPWWVLALAAGVFVGVGTAMYERSYQRVAADLVDEASATPA